MPHPASNVPKSVQEIANALYNSTTTSINISAIQGDASNFRVSALGVNISDVSNSDAGDFRVSGIQGDAGLNRISAFLDNGSVSAKSSDASTFRISAIASYVSAVIDNGSISARSGDANQIHVSSVQGDAGLLRISSFESVVTSNTGGASLYMTSSGATSQVSTIKSSAGRLYGYDVGNPAGVDQYLQVFNTSGGATAGTDTPTLTLYIPTLSQKVMSLGLGIAFSNGIQIIGTSTANGQTVGASALRANLFYA